MSERALQHDWWRATAALWLVALLVVAAEPSPSPPPSTVAPEASPFIVPLTWSAADYQYYVDAAVGSSSFRLLLDTGSANVVLWVPGNCTGGAASCRGRALFDGSAPGAFQVRA
jgi:hypothetical protein